MIGSTILFGVNYWIAKGLMPNHLEPLQIIFLRISGAFVLFSLVGVIFPKIGQARIEKKDFPRIILVSLLGITLNQILFFTGLNLTSPLDTAIINATNPLLVFIISLFVIKGSINQRKIIGLLVGVAGAIILIFGAAKMEMGNGSFHGNLLIFANTLCWSLYLIIAKPLLTKYPPFVLMKWIFLFGLLFALPFTLKPLLRIDFHSFEPSTWGALIYVILGTTFLAYLFILFGLKQLSANAVAVYTYMQPVIVALIGITLFGEMMTIVKISACLMIFLGIFLVNRNN
jgi:drug/metabolite transporter (DMT)-like permease